MRLKRLDLFGFKSFADRTVFDFGADTLTGVVGPNGCGKSNVVDAIRWVLGEQRPTSMRGAEMIDVIFKGSSSRPGLSVAEATLVLDNAGGVLAGRGAEVAITRRVFKSGEGEYLIDGERVRLKDVREMLFDTGLGSRGYSVLEQGRIDAVLSANPLERRRIFEEAAGISRYRQRKHEAELRLKRVDQDLARLDDVLGELRSRVRSLKIQAGKAERWVAARDAWTSGRRRLLRHRAWAYGARIDGLGLELAALERQSASLRAARVDSEGTLAEREREGLALAAELERLSGELSVLEGDARALDERKSQLAQAAHAQAAAGREEGERARALAARLAERRQELEALSAERAALAAGIARLGEARDEKQAALHALEQRAREERRAYERQNELVLGLLHEKTEAQNTARHLQDARGPAGERGERLAERLSEAEASVARLTAEEQRARAAAQAAEAALTEQSAARRALQAQAELQERQIEALEREETEHRLERARVQSRIEFLRDRERDLEELGETAREVLATLAQGVLPDEPADETSASAPFDPAALSGLVADRLTTQTRHARALDAVLGEHARALVARDEAAARRVARWLAATRRGPLGLAVEAGAARASEPRPPAREDDARVLGRLADHVRAEPGAEGLCERLVGDVLLVRDLDAGLELVREDARWRCVTLAGELVDARVLLVGHRSLTQGAVGRRSSAAELEAGLAETARRAEEIELALERARAARVEQAGLLASQGQELELARHVLGREQSALATALARKEDLAAALASLATERTRAGDEMRRLTGELENALSRREQAEQGFARENGRLAELDVGRRALEEDQAEAARERGRVELEHGRALEQQAGLERRHALIESASRETQAELARAERLAREKAEQARDSEASAERLAVEANALAARRGELKQRLAEARAVAEAAREAASGARRRSEDVTRELEAAAGRTTETRLAVQRAELALGEVLERAREELELDQGGLCAGHEPEAELAAEAALDALEADVRGLRAELDKLGPVNMEALGELDEVGTRLDFLETQRKDLAQAEAALRQTVHTIDEESKRLFLEAFEEVRGNFQRIFRQLFGGGRADVLLEEGQDVLEAGVEIVARPPGRELLSIGLLSGGQRTLTALALLFAVFEARPSPFCVLDEVDAALDDANIDRFLAMVEGYRASTQFVVVTHNKGTMAACEKLYGVTMETKGVSRRVQVELDQVDGFAARSSNGAATAQPARNGGEPTLERESGEPALERESGEPALDRESGEPVVEIRPARASDGGAVVARPAEAQPANDGTARRVGAGVDPDFSG